MNFENPKEMMDSFTKTLSINLFGQLLIVTTFSWAAECQQLASFVNVQAMLHMLSWMLLIGSTFANVTVVVCARAMRTTEGYEELAELSFRSVGLLTLLQLSMFFFTPAPYKLAFMAVCATMILRWSLAKGKFLRPTDFPK